MELTQRWSDETLDKRIGNVIGCITYSVWCYVSQVPANPACLTLLISN